MPGQWDVVSVQPAREPGPWDVVETRPVRTRTPPASSFVGAGATGRADPPRSVASRIVGADNALGQGMVDAATSNLQLAAHVVPGANATLLQPIFNSIPRYQPQDATERNLEVAGRNVSNAVLPGGPIARVASVALPVAGHAAGQRFGGDAGGTIGEVAGNIASGFRFGRAPPAPPVAPATVAARALRRGGASAVDPVAIRARQAEYAAQDIQPSLTDLTDDSGRRIIRAAASRPGEGQQAARLYNRKRNLDLPGNVGTHASRYISADDAGTARSAADARVQAAMESPPVVGAGEGGARVSARLNAKRDAAMADVNTRYDAARAGNAQQALIPRTEVARVADALQTSVEHYDPVRTGAVQREIQRYASGLTDVTAEDMLRTRSVLTNLAASSDTVEAGAARAARRAIDAEIDRTEPLMTGDTGAIRLWREANASRRAFGQQFEGGDLTQRITGRSVHGEGVTNTLAPEDVSNAVLGRAGVSPRPNLARDLARVRTQLGANSPEWEAFQHEAMDRILARDAGTEHLGRALHDFQRQSPELARLLIHPARAGRVAAARATIASGAADRAAIDAGSRFLDNKAPRPLVQTYGNLTPSQNALARAGAANAVEDAAGQGRGINALSVADQLAEGPNQLQLGNALLGPRDTNSLADAMRLEAGRVRNAQAINPSTGSGSHMNIATDNRVSGLVEAGQTGAEMMGAAGGHFPAALALLKRIGGRVTGLSDADAMTLVQHATSNDPAMVNAVIQEIDRLSGTPGAGTRFVQALISTRSLPALTGGVNALSQQSTTPSQ